jgi:hypothetical protein
MLGHPYEGRPSGIPLSLRERVGVRVKRSGTKLQSMGVWPIEKQTENGRTVIQ